MPPDDPKVESPQSGTVTPLGNVPNNQERLDQLEAALKDKEKALARSERQKAVLEQKATRVPPVPPQAPKPAPQAPQRTPQPQVDSDLAEQLAEREKELAAIKMAAKYGLSPDDEEVEHAIQMATTPLELQLQFEVLLQRREVEALKGQLNKPQRETVVDTGGRSGLEGNNPPKSKTFRDKAAELKKTGSYQAATWQALRAAHSDPSKRMPVVSLDDDN